MYRIRLKVFCIYHRSLSMNDFKSTQSTSKNHPNHSISPMSQYLVSRWLATPISLGENHGPLLFATELGHPNMCHLQPLSLRDRDTEVVSFFSVGGELSMCHWCFFVSGDFFNDFCCCEDWCHRFFFLG